MQALRDQISSSPLVPSPAPASPRHESLPPFSPGSPTPASRLSRKRQSEDLTPFVQSMTRKMKLRKLDAAELTTFSKYTPMEQQLYLAASLLKVNERQASFSPPDVIYIIPRSVKDRIDYLAFVAIMEPAIPAYLDVDEGPVSIILGKFEENPSWGITDEIRNDRAKLDVITSRIQTKLSARRHDLKKAIEESLGTEGLDGAVEGALTIIELCEALVKLYRRANIQITVQLCARIAFIRNMVAAREEGEDVKKFWKRVDGELASTRKDLVGEAKQSKFFAKILTLDRETYGQVDLDTISVSARAGTSRGRITSTTRTATISDSESLPA